MQKNHRVRQVISAVGFLVLSILAIYQPHTAKAATISGLRSEDVMKYTKDVMTSQPSDADIDSIVTALKSLGITHIAISVPLDATSNYPSSGKPSPRTAEAFTQKWADSIHSHGLNVIWRGTFSGLEGIYGFQQKVGSNRFPAGTASSAVNDGNNSWLGKIYRYITNNPSYFASGDVWAPLPERTQGIFSDSTSFLPSTGSGIQANYANFFNDLKTVSDKAFSSIGKNVTTGLSSNNFSEIKSGWLPQSIIDTAGYVAVDYYGTTHTPAEMDSDLRTIAKAKGKPVFLEEWGDYWDSNLSQSAETAYLQSMYSEINTLVKAGVVAGFNSWTGWTGTPESILTKDSSGFHLNFAGTILQNIFTSGPLVSLLNTLLPPPTPPSNPTLTCPTTAAYNAFTACYFKDQNLTTVGLVRNESAVYEDWGNGSPDSTIPSDHFSARYTGTYPFTASGTYTFKTVADDGVRLYVDGQLLIDEWHDNSVDNAHSATRYMAPGNHIIKVEYFDDTGGAVMKLSWWKNS